MAATVGISTRKKGFLLPKGNFSVCVPDFRLVLSASQSQPCLALIGRQHGRSFRCLAELQVQSGTWMASPAPAVNKGH